MTATVIDKAAAAPANGVSGGLKSFLGQAVALGWEVRRWP